VGCWTSAIDEPSDEVQDAAVQIRQLHRDQGGSYLVVPSFISPAAAEGEAILCSSHQFRLATIAYCFEFCASTSDGYSEPTDPKVKLRKTYES
jgi:hypothetical protein